MSQFGFPSFSLGLKLEALKLQSHHVEEMGGFVAISLVQKKSLSRVCPRLLELPQV